MKILFIVILIFVVLAIYDGSTTTDEQRAERVVAHQNTQEREEQPASPVIASAQASEKTTKEPDKGKWIVSKSRSPIDDSQNVALYLEAENSINPRLPIRPVYPALAIQCRENTTSLYVHWKTYLGIDARPMTHRIDKQKAKTRRWDISTDYEALGLWSGGQSIPFVKGLFGKQLLYATVTPYGESPVAATFNIAGLEEAIKPLRAACHW